ncbi:hypothetical protein ECANGB1_1702 [Enterospora canceri]|uniref:Uncharacterized protein n=1 Tax=Enterospora canceri TaxID=1081671 RepID=A0A1Y1S950_9MICR|nr:hypothetical protein ECANGB1_1702 [Enterospora canceri]
MEIFTRQFAYKDDLVFLLCDYYDDKYIPMNMYDVTDNLTLFPIGQDPVIDFILQNLLEQNYKNVVLVGDRIGSVIRHVTKSKFDILMSIAFLSNDALSTKFGEVTYVKDKKYLLDNIGQFFRTLLEFNIQNNFLVMMANQYSNFNIAHIRNFHAYREAHITFLVFERVTNDPEFFIYDHSDTGRVFGISKNTKRVNDVAAKCNRPGFFYTTPELCQLFNEFADARDMTQLIDELKSTFSFGKYKLYCINEEILTVFQKKNGGRTAEARDIVKVKESGFGELLQLVELDNDELAYLLNYEKNLFQLDDTKYYYSREITTLLDYINLCKEMEKHLDKLLNNDRISQHTELYKNEKNGSVYNLLNRLERMNVSHKFSIASKKEAQEYYIELTSGEIVDCCSIKDELFESESENSEDEKKETFFDECIDYMKKTMRQGNVELDEIQKNITLFKIYWNTSPHEVLEAYAMFFVEIILDELEKRRDKTKQNTTVLEDLVCNAADYFYLLTEELSGNIDLQKYFMDVLQENIEEELSGSIKYNVFYSYCYLLKSSRTIKKSLLKVYLKDMTEKEKEEIK